MPSHGHWQVYATGGFAAIGGFLFGYDLGVISGVIVMSNFIKNFGDQTSLARGSLTSGIRAGQLSKKCELTQLNSLNIDLNSIQFNSYPKKISSKKTNSIHAF